MSSLSDVESAGKKLREELSSNIIVTRGKHGMTLFSDKTITVPTYAKEVFDVTGAGDTAIAAIALSIASGASLEESILIANHASGIKVEKAGTYAVSNSELYSRLMKGEGKIMSLDKILRAVSDLKKKGKKIVWTNGCFDLLHVGHTRYLSEAKKFGDVLIIGLNSDSSVKQLKDPTRPIQNENERAEILASLGFVDYVIIYPEKTCENYLSMIKPDIFVKGGDYSMDVLLSHPEGQAVKSYGGQIKTIALVEGRSTTKIIEKLNNKSNV